MVVTQTADKIQVITITAIMVVDAAGTEIHKDMLKQQNADGNIVDMVHLKIAMTMTIGGTAVHPEIAIMITMMTTEDTDAVMAVPHTAIMKTVAEEIQIIVVMITMEEEKVTADGLAILKDMQKLRVADGKIEVVITAVATTAATVIVVTDAMVVMMMTAMVRDVVGMATLKVMRKQLIEAGKTVDTKIAIKNRPKDRASFVFFNLIY
jgi:hypothetical protein